MNEQTLKYLKLARVAREEDNTEDAKRYYDTVRTEEPENGEAKFFYQFFALLEGKNGELATRFERLCNVVPNSIKQIASSADSDDEKLAIVKAITEAFVPKTWSLNRYMNQLTVGTGNERQRVLPASDISSVNGNGILTLYALGDTIEQCFGSNMAYMTYAVMAWKEAITLQQKWYSVIKDTSLPEKYTNKVKAIDPSYEMPKKAGCIDLANRR